MTGFAKAADWARFLQPVVASVRNPPSPDDFRGRCAALAFACRVEAADLTDARARDLCRKSEFWPSVAEIEAVFADVWKAKAFTRSIANAGGANLLPSEPAKVIDAVASVLNFRAVADARENMPRETLAAEKPTGKPLPLRDTDLLAAYERSNSPAMQFRAAQIRKAMEETAA